MNSPSAGLYIAGYGSRHCLDLAYFLSVVTLRVASANNRRPCINARSADKFLDSLGVSTRTPQLAIGRLHRQQRIAGDTCTFS